jgi:hypothetical protein
VCRLLPGLVASQRGLPVRMDQREAPIERRSSTSVGTSHAPRRPRRCWPEWPSARHVNRPDGRVFAAQAVEADLSGIARAVYRVLDDHLDRNRTSRPGVPTLAADTGFGKTAVRYALRELEGAGFVERWEQDGKPAIFWLPELPVTLSTAPPPNAGANTRTPPPDPSNPTARPLQPHRQAVPKAIESVRKRRAREFSSSTGGAAASPQGAAAPSTEPCLRCADPDVGEDGVVRCPDCGRGWIAPPVEADDT